MDTSNVKQNIKRDHSWKRYLRWNLHQDDQKRHDFVKAVLDDNEFDIQNPASSLKKIAAKIDDTATWRYCIVNLDDFWNYGYGWLCFDQSRLYSFWGAKRSHRHREVYSYYFWKKYLETASLNHVSKKTYHESNRAEDFPRIDTTWELENEEIILSITGVRNCSKDEEICDAIKVELYKADDSVISNSVKKKFEDTQFIFRDNKGAEKIFFCDKMTETYDAIVECLKKIDK